MREPLELSVLVVSYNTAALTLECLVSVFRETKRTRFEVIVIDNDSSDGSYDKIRESFPQVRVIKPGRNLGFARANNIAAQTAAGEYLLLLNPDTVVLDGAIDRLMAFAKSAPEAGVWGGRTIFGDGRLNPTSCWRRLSLWNLFCVAAGLAYVFPNNPILNSVAYGGWHRDTVREVDIVTGCFFLIRAEDWRRLGGFDERFFMYGEEADLCLRARKLGLRPKFTPDAAIVHYGGASEPVRANKLLQQMAAKALLIRTHFNRLTRGPGLLLLVAWSAIRAAAYGLAARLAPQRYKAHFQTWKTVLCAAPMWLHGYPELQVPARHTGEGQ